MDGVKDLYKDVEVSTKRKIINFFGQQLTEEQLRKLNETEYIDDEIVKIHVLNDVVDYFLEKMLSDLLTKECYKEIEIDQNEKINVPIGETLRNVLVDYYKVSIADRATYYPVLKAEDALDVDYLHNINDVFDSVIDKNAFTKNVEELSNIEELKFYITNTILNDIDIYLNNKYVMGPTK